MAFKRFGLTLLFVLVFAQILFAQKSASATMTVSVRVVEGASVEIADATTSPLNLIRLKEGAIKLADVNLSHLSGKTVSIERPTKLTLTNENGEKVSLKLSELNEATDSEFSYQLGPTKEVSKLKKGNYKGSLTTSIVYI